jgi:serine/threonine protein kinase
VVLAAVLVGSIVTWIVSRSFSMDSTERSTNEDQNVLDVEETSIEVVEEDRWMIEPYQWTFAHGVEPIGKGTFGCVSLACDDITRKEFCVKTMSTEPLMESEMMLNFVVGEINILATFRHVRIVAYLGEQVSVTKNELYIFMEYCSGGSLQANMKKYGRMKPQNVQTFGLEIMEGLDFLHTADPSIVHRDIKPGNILLTHDGHCKLADFGLAKLIHGAATNENCLVGTPCYAPPERYYGEQELTPAFDVWSVGSMIYEMLTGQPLLINMIRQETISRHPDATDAKVERMVDRFFDHDPAAKRILKAFTSMVVLDQVRTGEIRESASYEFERIAGQVPRPVLSPSVDTHALDLICTMLSLAEERPSMRELMSHPFFQVKYPAIPSGDPENRRFRTVRVLRDMNAGEAATNTANAMKTPGADSQANAPTDTACASTDTQD